MEARLPPRRQPEVGTRTEGLESRIEARRRQLGADPTRAKADAQGKLNDTGEAIEKKLASRTEARAGGWETLSDATVDRSNAWLEGSLRAFRAGA